MIRFVIRADDIGYSRAVNHEIPDAYLLKHSSLTVNRTKKTEMLRDPEVKKIAERLCTACLL